MLNTFIVKLETIQQRTNIDFLKGIKVIDEKPRKGAEGLDIAFLHPKSTFGVLIELCEKKEKE